MASSTNSVDIAVPRYNVIFFLHEVQLANGAKETCNIVLDYIR